MKKISIGKGSFLTVDDCVLNSEVYLHPSAKIAMQASENFLVSEIKKRKKIYGISTQFGDQATEVDPLLTSETLEAYLQSINQRQHKIVKSLVCGMGPLVSPKIVKLTMILRAHCLSQGYSGVSINLINKMLEWINVDVTPCVYTYGSIGASGDLIPLATIAAAMIGEPIKVNYQEKILFAHELTTIKPYHLHYREGLALINGTSFMTAIAALSFVDLQRIFLQMIHIIGMTLEVLQVNTEAYDPLVHQVKGHSGSIKLCEILKPFMQQRSKTEVLQDYYSLRSVCQGFGPMLENLEICQRMLEIEINSVNDNPIIDAEQQRILHGANFMGYYITHVCDSLKMDIAQASTWLHALLANLYHPRKNRDLPTNLMEDAAVHNGFRGLQLLAAALAVENRKLAQTHQSFMLPTEGDNQDVNSLGTHAALDLQKSVENLERLCAITYLSAAQAWEFRKNETMSSGSKKLYDSLRKIIPAHHEDKIFQPLLDDVMDVLKQNDLG